MGNGVWDRELNQRPVLMRGTDLGSHPAPLTRALCPSGVMFPRPCIQLLRVNTQWFIFTYNKQMRHCSALLASQLCALWDQSHPGESQHLIPRAMVWEERGHLRGTVEIWDPLCLLSGEAGAEAASHPHARPGPGAGVPIMFFPSCAPQSRFCALTTTFVLLTPALALWVLFSAS